MVSVAMVKGSVTMGDNIISFLLGVFIGGNLSFFALALLMASKSGDKHNDD